MTTTRLDHVFTIAKKELRGYFGSPIALIFLALFLALTLFTFFWVDKFFARGITDLRPLFDRLPILMILLVGALSMRLWSEEKKVGTIEVLMTLPVPRWQLVAGKFAAGMALIAIALLLTFGVPLTVSRMGDLDWGPVIGGYVAALLLAAAYLAIGMCVSAATDNQIVALFGTMVVCLAAYLPGAGPIADLAGYGWGQFLRHLGTGSRFESIARGVLDLRDIAYYLGLVVVFLGLNVWLLGRQTAGKGRNAVVRRRLAMLTLALVTANIVAFNLWLAPISRARVDLTQHNEYRLSETTEKLLGSLDQPLLIRGYFSGKTHPLLAPLVPRIRDLLDEYRIAGDGRVRVEFVDPSGSDDAIEEAKEKYDISPSPLPVESRMETSVINAYFAVLVEYGDQHAVLGMNDLLEFRRYGVDKIDVKLKNFEYDVSRTIKKVASEFQSVESMFASLPGKVEIIAYVTPDTLPADLKPGVEKLDAAVKELEAQANGKLSYTKVAPTADADRMAAFQQYGVRGMQDLFTGTVYYFAIVLKVGNRAARIMPPADLGQETMKNSLVEGLKRAAPGFTKVVGLWVPPAPPPEPPMMQGMPPQRQRPPQTFEELRRSLSGQYEVSPVALDGPVPDEVEVLVLAGPSDLPPDAAAAVDQFVMRGGALVVLAGRYRIAPSMMGGLGVEKVTMGIEELFGKWGIRLGDDLVLDPESETFPIPNQRRLREGDTIPEYINLEYPYFVRVDEDRIGRGTVITAGVPGAVMYWPSPLSVDDKLGTEPRKIEKLLTSSSGTWLSDSTDIQPKFDLWPEKGFGAPKDLAKDKRGSQVLGVAITGGFPSATVADPGAGTGSGSGSGTGSGAGSGSGAEQARKLAHSPPDTRIVVFSSSAFATDDVLAMASELRSELSKSNLKLVENAIDWALADTEMLQIRARSSSSRALTVKPDSRGSWEILNYAIALAGLVIVLGVMYVRRRRVVPIDLPKEVAP